MLYFLGYTGTVLLVPSLLTVRSCVIAKTEPFYYLLEHQLLRACVRRFSLFLYRYCSTGIGTSATTSTSFSLLESPRAEGRVAVCPKEFFMVHHAVCTVPVLLQVVTTTNSGL